MKTTDRDYDTEARDDARRMVGEVIDDVLESLKSKGEADKYYNDYYRLDEYHHENHVDREYSLKEAAELTAILSDVAKKYIDYGLWQSLGPKQAISCQAAYTYGNAVAYHFQGMIEAVNSDAQDGILADMLSENQEIDGVEEYEVPDDVMKARIMEVCEDY